VVKVRGLVASWATQPWNVFGGDEDIIQWIYDVSLQYDYNLGYRAYIL
jgi:hypothetical protein